MIPTENSIEISKKDIETLVRLSQRLDGICFDSRTLRDLITGLDDMLQDFIYEESLKNYVNSMNEITLKVSVKEEEF